MLAAPSLPDILAARSRISDIAFRTPLVPLVDASPSSNILLKLESLQPVGSFKLRGAANAMRTADAGMLTAGVYTASAGNMAQGVAWCARALDIPCRVVVPESAPDTKTRAIARLGAQVVRVPFDEWWQTLLDRMYLGMPGLFVHPFADADVIAGNGTIGLEIVEDAPEVDAVLVPWGGGGLACGIAAAIRALKPRTRVYAIEVDTAAPLTASFALGSPATVVPVRTFIDGMGGKAVLPDMWSLAQELLAGVLTVSVAQVAAAVKLLAERGRVVAEGAGAAPVAAALAGVPDATTVACIVSGGNIDGATLATILRGELP
jgi:threonine dehydratase